MGTAVLDAGSSSAPDLHLYSHCLPEKKGGVALLAINLDRTESRVIDLPTGAERYTLTARNLSDTHVQLNGRDLELGAHDELPVFASASIQSGPVRFGPATITFLAITGAHNPACQ